MHRIYTITFFLFLWSISLNAQSPIFSPGMPISCWNSCSSPGGEGVTNAIDGTSGNKFLDFREVNTGFYVNTSCPTIAVRMRLTTANDSPERDPRDYIIEGSNNGSTWTSIATGNIPCTTARLFGRNFNFTNTVSYSWYRIRFNTVCNTAAANSMQIAEVQLYGGKSEINVQGNGNNILTGRTTVSTNDNTNFSDVCANSKTNSYTIQNTGTGPLNISSMTSSNVDFVINNAPTSIAAGSNATFDIIYTPSSTTTTTSIITINNNDCNEGVYTYNVSGRDGGACTIGTGLDLDGSNDFVEINSVADDMAGQTNVTVEAWFNADATQAGNDIIVAANSSGGGNNILWLYLDDGLLGVNNLANIGVTFGADLRGTGWHHAAVVYDGTDYDLYLDGLLVGTVTAAAPVFAANNKWSIGQEYDGSLSRGNYFKGKIDEVRIWNTDLCPSDIYNRMNCELLGTETNLAAYYRMNQGFVDRDNYIETTVTDRTANGNTGNLTNLSLIGTTSNWNVGASVSASSCVVVNAPEIEVRGNNVLIPDGTANPLLTDHTRFEAVSFIGGPVSTTRTYTIHNTSSGNLHIGRINLVGVDAADFSTSFTAITLAGGATTTFTLTFAPSTGGVKVAEIEILNTDCDETIYNFEIAGVALEILSEVRGQMLSLNGTSDHVIIDNVAGAIAGATEFTFEAWINADATQAGNDRIVCVNTSGGGNVILFHLDNGRLETYDGATDTYGSPDLRGTGWHHVAFTHDNTTHKVYLDGVLLDSKGGSVTTFAANNQWSIGQEWDNGSKGDYFKGKMDEVRIWKDVRTQQEIRERMHLSLESRNLMTSDDNLVAYYQFDADGAAGTVNGVKDALGNNGTSFGGAYTDSEVSVGRGHSNTQVVNAAINYMFVNTDLELTFSGVLPNDEVVVTKIVTELPHNESANIMVYNPGVYWVVDNYGVNAGLNVSAKFKFADGAISNTTIVAHQIHKRGSREYDVSDWLDMTASAVGVALGDNHVTVNNLTSFSQFALTSNTSTFVPTPSLPIELISFKVKRETVDQVELYWITATEVNNKGFYIERMLGIEDEFKSIGWVDGNGTTAVVTYYHDTDENSYKGISYYRLKQVDVDGTITYSEIRAVEGLERAPIDVNVYPNPAQNHLNIRFDNLPEEVETAKIEIRNINGQILNSKVVSLDAYEVLQINEIELLIPSIYLLSVEMDNGELLLYKFIKE